MLSPFSISEDELSENYQYWISQWNPLEKPTSDVIDKMSSILPTHTFVYSKTVDGIKTYPYRKIFGIGEDAQGLLSDAFRFKNSLFGNKEVRRSMSVVRNIGLDNYVFAYLGSHESFYGRTPLEDPDLDARPFGVFINPELEKYPKCIPSRRDINVNKTHNAAELRREFVHTTDARMLAAQKVANDGQHSKDFWHYFGGPEYFKNEDYLLNAWKEKIEYHYFEKVEVDDIVAVLWPIWYAEASEPGVIDWDPSYYEIKEIIGKFPHIKVVTYEWDVIYPELSFLEASYYSTKYFLKNQLFPLSAELAKAETYDD